MRDWDPMDRIDEMTQATLERKAIDAAATRYRADAIRQVSGLTGKEVEGALIFARMVVADPAAPDAFRTAYQSYIDAMETQTRALPDAVLTEAA